LSDNIKKEPVDENFTRTASVVRVSQKVVAGISVAQGRSKTQQGLNERPKKTDRLHDIRLPPSCQKRQGGEKGDHSRSHAQKREVKQKRKEQ